MKKSILLLMMSLLVLCSYGCRFVHKGPIDIETRSNGYAVAIGLLVPEPECSLDQTILATFEYGHEYDMTFYADSTLVHMLSVFVSDSTANWGQQADFVSLYTETFESEFFDAEYRCNMPYFIFGNTVFCKSFSLEIDPDEVPYEMGMLYFALSRGEANESYQEMIERLVLAIYFIKTDTEFILTPDNPFSECSGPSCRITVTTTSPTS